VLVVNRKLRVANDVDEQDMGDFELDLFLSLNGHLCGARLDYVNSIIAPYSDCLECQR
jgi:hypothetical protein